MRKTVTRLLGVGLLAAALICLALSISDRGSPLSLEVVGFTTNRWTDADLKAGDEPEYVCAVLILTNSSRKPIQYWAWFGTQRVDHRLLHHTPTGWEDQSVGEECGMGLVRNILQPSQGISFEAVVDRDRPCRVAVDYMDARERSELLKHLWAWMPWFHGSDMVVSETVDLRTPAL
jgi:hypothetical protein